MTLRPKLWIAPHVLVLASLACGASALAQDDEFFDAPPPPPMEGGEFGGESFGEPPVAPLTPNGTEPPPFLEPPPSLAPPVQKPATRPSLVDPNPGAAFSGADDSPEDEFGEETFAEEEAPKTSEAPPSEAPAATPRKGRASGRAKVDVEELLLPPYQRKKPQWAIGLAFAPKALGTESATTTRGKAYAVAAQFEFQPRFLQKIGVIGIGPTLSYTTGQGTDGFKIYGLAGQIRYQARFFREQPIVPMAAYSFGMGQYRFDSGTKGTITVSGPSFGAWFLLNFADPASAASFYADYGISRSYLVAELHLPSGSDSAIEFGGSSYYFGLRVEF